MVFFGTAGGAKDRDYLIAVVAIAIFGISSLTLAFNSRCPEQSATSPNNTGPTGDVSVEGDSGQILTGIQSSSP
jgi:hypothetical protein